VTDVTMQNVTSARVMDGHTATEMHFVRLSVSGKANLSVDSCLPLPLLHSLPCGNRGIEARTHPVPDPAKMQPICVPEWSASGKAMIRWRLGISLHLGPIHSLHPH